MSTRARDMIHNTFFQQQLTNKGFGPLGEIGHVKGTCMDMNKSLVSSSALAATRAPLLHLTIVRLGEYVEVDVVETKKVVQAELSKSRHGRGQCMSVLILFVERWKVEGGGV